MESKPKILFVVTQSEFGGGQRFLFNLNSNIRDEYQTLVCVGADGGGEFLEALQHAQIPCQRVLHLRRAIRPLDDIRCVLDLARVIRECSPEIIFLTSSKSGVLGTLAAMLARLQGGRFTLIYRIDWAFNDPRPAIERKMYAVVEKFLSKFRDIILQNDRFDLQSARRHGIKPRLGFKVMHNGIDIERLRFLERSEAHAFFSDKLHVDLRAFDVVIGNTANYYRTKGLTYLIEAMALLVKTVNAACIIVGEGTERTRLQELIRSLGLEGRVFLAGQLPEASRYLKAYDIFAFSSVKEGFPWAILEAMAAGLPIVATRVGAMPEVIEDGTSGWLVDPADAGQLADKLQWFCTHREALSQFGKSAKQRVQQQFTLARLLENYRKLFRSVVAKKFDEITFD